MGFFSPAASPMKLEPLSPRLRSPDTHRRHREGLVRDLIYQGRSPTFGTPSSISTTRTTAARKYQYQMEGIWCHQMDTYAHTRSLVRMMS